MAKKALYGFSRLKLFPLITNTAAAYSVGEGFFVPEAQKLAKQADSNSTKIYADDTLYAEIKSVNGLNVTITVAEVTLKLMADMGLGTFDSATGVFSSTLASANKSFAASFRALRMDESYRMYKFYNFTINDIQDAGLATKGDGSSIVAYDITGTFSARACDGKTYDMADTGETVTGGGTAPDITWLDTIDTVA